MGKIRRDIPTYALRFASRRRPPALRPMTPRPSLQEQQGGKTGMLAHDSAPLQGSERRQEEGDWCPGTVQETHAGMLVRDPNRELVIVDRRRPKIASRRGGSNLRRS
jgi:hypothetical protein